MTPGTPKSQKKYRRIENSGLIPPFLRWIGQSVATSLSRGILGLVAPERAWDRPRHEVAEDRAAVAVVQLLRNLRQRRRENRCHLGTGPGCERFHYPVRTRGLDDRLCDALAASASAAQFREERRTHERDQREYNQDDNRRPPVAPEVGEDEPAAHKGKNRDSGTQRHRRQEEGAQSESDDQEHLAAPLEPHRNEEERGWNEQEERVPEVERRPCKVAGKLCCPAAEDQRQGREAGGED